MELTVGTPIKYKKRKFGIITGVGPERFGKTIEFVWHSGIKPRHSRGAPEDFQPISLERFKHYIKDSGHTSMRGYLLPIPQAVVSDAPAAVHQPDPFVKQILVLEVECETQFGTGEIMVRERLNIPAITKITVIDATEGGGE